MKVLTNKTVFEHKWENVTKALWLKYPNPFSTHVITADIIDRYVDPVTGCLHTKRLLLKTSSIPAWSRSLVGIPEAYIIEESMVDPTAKSMTMSTQNVSLKKVMRIEEVQRFEAHPDNPKWTSVHTEARFSSSLRWGLKAAVESFCTSKFKDNVERSRNAILYILERLRSHKLARRQQPHQDA